MVYDLICLLWINKGAAERQLQEPEVEQTSKVARPIGDKYAFLLQ
jgi:hypothetical protein